MVVESRDSGRLVGDADSPLDRRGASGTRARIRPTPAAATRGSTQCAPERSAGRRARNRPATAIGKRKVAASISSPSLRAAPPSPVHSTSESPDARTTAVAASAMYRPMYTMALSIAASHHRRRAVRRTAAVRCWLMAAAAGRRLRRGRRAALARLVKMLLAGWLLAFVYHLCNGIRHLVLGPGPRFERHEARRSARGRWSSTRRARAARDRSAARLARRHLMSLRSRSAACSAWVRRRRAWSIGGCSA